MATIDIYRKVNSDEVSVTITFAMGKSITATLTPTQFALAITGRSANPCEISTRNVEVVLVDKKPKPLTICAAGRDGECNHSQCPQLRDKEPHATGRHCPIDTWDDEEKE